MRSARGPLRRGLARRSASVRFDYWRPPFRTRIEGVNPVIPSSDLSMWSAVAYARGISQKFRYRDFSSFMQPSYDPIPSVSATISGSILIAGAAQREVSGSYFTANVISRQVSGVYLLTGSATRALGGSYGGLEIVSGADVQAIRRGSYGPFSPGRQAFDHDTLEVDSYLDEETL